MKSALTSKRIISADLTCESISEAHSVPGSMRRSCQVEISPWRRSCVRCFSNSLRNSSSRPWAYEKKTSNGELVGICQSFQYQMREVKRKQSKRMQGEECGQSCVSLPRKSMADEVGFIRARHHCSGNLT